MNTQNTQDTVKLNDVISEVKPKKSKALVSETLNYDSEIKTLKREIATLRKRVEKSVSSDIFFEYTKIRNVRSPERGTSQSAGIDFFIPNDFPTTDLKPHEDVLIPSGIKVKIPDGTALIFKNKSGIATKLKLGIGAEVVDSDYQGEIHLHLINTSSKITRISAGMKIAQAILLPYFNVEITEKMSVVELYGDVVTDRGTGGFGSTNKTVETESKVKTPEVTATGDTIYEVWLSQYSMGNTAFEPEYVGKIGAKTFNEACTLLYTKDNKVDPRYSVANNSYMGIPLLPSRTEAAKSFAKLF